LEIEESTLKRINNSHHAFTEKSFRVLTVVAASLLVLIMVGIFVQLVWNSRLSIERFGFGFLFSSEWNPATENYGALSSIFGTLVSSSIAMFLAVPTAIVTALFLVELAPPSLSKITGGAIELLAAIPSIIYGMWGLFVFVPFMADFVQPFLIETFGELPIFSLFFDGAPMGIGMLSAGIILALMILPIVTSVMRDVFVMVPSVVKESAYGMGSTTWEVTQKVTIRYGIRGVIGACFLGLGRAIGETMAITFIIGNSHEISLSLMDAGNSIASTLANEFAEASEPLYLNALMELALVLLVMTVIIQIGAQWWVSKLKKSMGAGL